MSYMKDFYLRELEAEMADLEGAGVPPHHAYELASARAYDRAREKLANIADRLRQEKKHDGT